MQTLVHFTYFSFAKFLDETGVSLKDVLKFQTLPSAYFFSFVARVLMQDKRTYSNIQLQPGAAEIRAEFLAASIKFSNDIEDISDTDILVNELESISLDLDDAELGALFASTESSILSFDNNAALMQKFVRTQELVLVSTRNDLGEVGYFVGQVSENQKEAFVLRRAVFALQDSTSSSLKLAFYGDGFESYYENLELTAASFVTQELGTSFIRIEKRSAELSGGSTLQGWLWRNVNPAKWILRFQSEIFDASLFEEMSELVKNESGNRIHVNFSKFNFSSESIIEGNLEVSFFPNIEDEQVELILNQSCHRVFGHQLMLLTT